MVESGLDSLQCNQIDLITVMPTKPASYSSSSDRGFAKSADLDDCCQAPSDLQRKLWHRCPEVPPQGLTLHNVKLLDIVNLVS